ncbi:hypothetical protein RHO15_06020 [Utexia brackfieldae]|uniref:hypothetical protein n=1 Tax=Utexia brackfieldae TaxID=3074108 RepID=UPI00370D6151
MYKLSLLASIFILSGCVTVYECEGDHKESYNNISPTTQAPATTTDAAILDNDTSNSSPVAGSSAQTNATQGDLNLSNTKPAIVKDTMTQQQTQQLQKQAQLIEQQQQHAKQKP